MTSKSTLKDQRNNLPADGAILLRDYIQKIGSTDKLPQDKLYPVLMGLFGEVGSIISTAKKHIREDAAYTGYQQALEEEFGDTLWYFAILCQRLDIGVDIIYSEVMNQDEYNKTIAESDLLDRPISHDLPEVALSNHDRTFLNLGEAVAIMLGIKRFDEKTHDFLYTFLERYLQSIQAANLSFSKIVRMNIDKTRGRFLEPDASTLPSFDSDFPDEERLPQHFEIKVTQRKSGQCYLQWNGVFIGEPLTDNILDPDGYRFHDVFHFAYAAILHWSPTFRSLIKQKRKSVPRIDEAQDGGRAIVIEEGLTAWIYSQAKHLNLFEGERSISFDLLKVVKQFVQGYEVEDCPLKLWEQAILEGYDVFRKVRNNNGGIVVGDRRNRSITYKPIDKV